MVLPILSSLYASPLLRPLRTHLPHIILSIVLIYILHLLSQGRKTSRDRDLHARTILLTGAFDSALGITLLVELARRGASVVCLTERDVGRAGAGAGSGKAKKVESGEATTAEEEKNPYEEDEDDSDAPNPTSPSPETETEPEEDHGDPHIHTLVSLVRATTRNANVWAETCDIEDPSSVKNFCVRWLTGHGAGDTTGGSPNESERDKERRLKEKEARAKEPSLDGQGGAPADQRLDAIVFTHEYPSLGSILPSYLSSSSSQSPCPSSQSPSLITNNSETQTREQRSLGTFLLTTLLLPSLLVAPTERDIRIVNVVGPFYAAAVRGAGGEYGFGAVSGLGESSKGRSREEGGKMKTGDLSSKTNAREDSKAPKKLEARSTFLSEGIRSLRTIVFTRHLQRILDALPAPPVVHPSATSSTNDIPVPARALQRSNIVAVSVSPGVGRGDTVGRLVGWGKGKGGVTFGAVLYILFHPLLRIFTKSPTSAVQSVLHALFLPTAFKSAGLEDEDGDSESSAGVGSGSGSQVGSGSVKNAKAGDGVEGKRKGGGGGNKLRFREVLKPGALYGECAVVTLDVPVLSSSSSASTTPSSSSKGTSTQPSQRPAAASLPNTNANTKQNSNPKFQPKSEETPEIDMTIADDGEYGGEEVGRRVWEAYEGALRAWEGGV